MTDIGRETYSRDLPAMQVRDRQNTAFPEMKSMHQVVVRAYSGRAGDVAGALAGLAERAKSDPRLVIGEATVKTYLLRIFAKLDVRDRTHAVVVALEQGLLTGRGGART